jgi:hypothetical protein
MEETFLTWDNVLIMMDSTRGEGRNTCDDRRVTGTGEEGTGTGFGERI